MGTAKINVWITDIGKPCKISSDSWMVIIADCGGRVLEWCGKRYVFWAECGHVEIPDVPPGCYVVAAAKFIAAGPPVYFNFATDFTVVRVNCGDVACVTLYVPTYPRCGYLLKLATQMLLRQEGVPKEAGQGLIQAIDKVLEYAPRPILEMERAEFWEKLWEELRKQAEGPQQG